MFVNVKSHQRKQKKTLHPYNTCDRIKNDANFSTQNEVNSCSIKQKWNDVIQRAPYTNQSRSPFAVLAVVLAEHRTTHG